MPTRITSRVFVGRQHELTVLAASLARARDAGPGTVLIAGEAGVGKTRLVSELRRMSMEAGLAWGAGGCVALGEGALPFGPVAAAMDSLLAGLDDAMLRAVLGQRARDLVRIMPGLAERLPGLEPSDSDEWFRARLFESVVTSIAALAARMPLVLVFEDVHWADPASLDLMAFLMRSPRRGRALVVATYRSDELHRRHPLLPWLAEIGRLDEVERIELDRLDDEEVAAQIAGILDGHPRSGLVDEIRRRSAGNPFFVEELLAADARGTPGRLPSSLREVLLGRLAVLGDGARSVVEVASVAAQPIAPPVIAALMPAGSGSLDAWLREAVENHVLTVTDKATGELGFRHALVQEAVYDELLPGESARLHLAFGAALAAQGEPEPARRAAWWAERAHHAIAAKDQSGALVASVAAGRAAFDVAAFAAAHDHFERAIELFDVVPDAESRVGEDRLALMELAAIAATYAGRDARSFALRRAAVSNLDPTAPAQRRAELLLFLTDSGSLSYEERIAATREANALLAAEPPSALRARAEANLARELSATEHWPEALTVSMRAVETAISAGDPSAEAVARVRLARSLAAVGRQVEGEGEAERALALARVTRDRRILGIVFTHAARVHEGVGNMRRSAAIHDEAAGIAAELGVRESDFELFRAWNYFQVGDWKTTFTVLAEHERLAPELDNRFHTLSTLVNARAGRFDSALSHQKEDAHPDAGTRSVVRAELALWSDRPTEAAEHARAGLASETVPYQFESWKGWLSRSLARAEADLAIRARRRGRAGEAAAAADRAAAAARELERLMAGPVSYRDRHGGELPVSLTMAKAEAARAAGRHDPRLWAAAADEWAVLERPFEIAYARWREAEAILAIGGSRTEARDRLVEAASIARRLGAVPISDAVGKLASRARIKLPDIPGDAIDEAAASLDRHAIGATLTSREREVLALLCRGASNRQIAETLFITESTAGVHVSNILGKLDVGSRTEAVAVAHMAGLVRP